MKFTGFLLLCQACLLRFFSTGCLGWKKQGMLLGTVGKALVGNQEARESQRPRCTTAFGLILSLRSYIAGPCEDFIPLSTLLQNAVWQDPSLIFRVTS